MGWELVMGLEIEWGLDMGQGLRQGGIREGVRITIYHAYYYLVIKCSVLTSLHGYFKACKNSHVRWTSLKNSALTLEVIFLFSFTNIIWDFLWDYYLKN